MECELKIEQECRQQMQEANSSEREKLERARRELASVKKIKQVRSCSWCEIRSVLHFYVLF